jgi:hypothetical protein
MLSRISSPGWAGFFIARGRLMARLFPPKSGRGFNADDEKDAQCLGQGAQLGRMHWVEQVSRLLLVFANSSTKLGFANSGVPEGI